MIFRKYFSLRSNKNPEDLAKSITGQHLQVHGLDFEIYQKEDCLKIIPHAEEDQSLQIIPITRLRLIKTSSGGTSLKVICKPRKIDAGGPSLLAVFLALAFFGGLFIYIRNLENYLTASYILMASSLFFSLLFFYKLERGYYDYIRKIKDWLKTHV